MDELQAIAERLEKSVDKSTAMSAKTRMEFEVMAEIQKDERLKMQEMHNNENADMRKHYSRIIMGLILALILILSGILGGAIYLLTNFDFAVATYQSQDVTDNGIANIYDGINYSKN